MKPSKFFRGAVLVMLLALTLFLLSCGKEPSIYENRFRMNEVDFSTWVVTDRETGVEYLVHNGGGICPLYNSDGTLYIANGWRDGGGA